MKTWSFFKLKCNISIRKHLLNLLLLLFSPSKNFIIALSQDLDKYIVLYQKELISVYNAQRTSKSIEEIAA